MDIEKMTDLNEGKYTDFVNVFTASASAQDKAGKFVYGGTIAVLDKFSGRAFYSKTMKTLEAAEENRKICLDLLKVAVPTAGMLKAAELVSDVAQGKIFHIEIDTEMAKGFEFVQAYIQVYKKVDGTVVARYMAVPVERPKNPPLPPSAYDNMMDKYDAMLDDMYFMGPIKPEQEKMFLDHAVSLLANSKFEPYPTSL